MVCKTRVNELYINKVDGRASTFIAHTLLQTTFLHSESSLFHLVLLCYPLCEERVMEAGRSEVGVSRVWAGLWVGAARAITAHELDTRGITTLVWATPEVDPPDLPVLVKDDPEQDISPYFPVVAEAFKECRDSGGRGLAVVCRAGISRSASLALAALVGQTDLEDMTLRHAYLTLITYEVEVRGRSTVAMQESPYEAGEHVPEVYLEELSDGLGSTFTFFPL
ncbi:Dual specificity protein phosphatase 14-like 1 [Homarus americanus]|uniref:Dual specificity protein phosphatase 14-like 1 n=1 Tax=Homarus americanus TaxID=6706 RepID=A0A8J5JXA4_HOMAM|nr:Dual specificity protein phosphatase 14-like 1 [Homarus americanus]